MNTSFFSTTRSFVCKIQAVALVVLVATIDSGGCSQTITSAAPDTHQHSRLTSEPGAGATQPFADDESTTETRMHRLDVKLFSVIPEVGPSSYRDSSGPGTMITGLGGMVGPAYTGAERQFGVQIRPQMVDGKLSAAIKLTPWPADSVIQERSFDVDLSNMDAKTVELGRATDGRVYKLSLVPSMEITPPEIVKPISDAFKKVEELRFDNSSVILNGDSYVGTIFGMSGAGRAYVDIPGLGRVDFSLVQLRGSEKMGSLKDGHLKLRIPNGMTLEIYNVLSEIGSKLSDGPYEVWGKWKAAKETTEEAVAKALALYEKEKASGNPQLNNPAVKHIIERLKNGKPLMSYGGAGLSDSERVAPEP